MNKPVAIVLGGTYPHKLLINNLKLRGYYTVLIDYFAFPPAKIDADEHIQESTLDKEKVLGIAKEKNASLVISTCIDHANVTACYVAEKLKLPAPYSYEIAISVTNKEIMKEKMVRNGIPTAKHIVVNEKKLYNAKELNFPVIVKPTDSNSSKGVRKANNPTELGIFLDSAIKISRNKTAVIEEYVDGIEIGADFFIQNKEATVLMTRERQKLVVDNENPVQQIQGSYFPADLTIENLKNLKILAERIAEVFALDNTPLLIQAILKDDNIYILEFAPRVSGGEGHNIIKLRTGFDIIDSAVNSFLGLPVKLDFNYGKDYYSDVFIYAKPGLFDKITGYEELMEDKTIEFFHLFKVPGTEIGTDISSNNRIGSFLVKSETKEELSEKIKKSLNKIEVYDILGNPVMRKDIYTY